VNDVFPEDIPLTTTPPILLSKLPLLPQELAYRFVGRDLTLNDTKTGLIVDVIPKAIPRDFLLCLPSAAPPSSPVSLSPQ
jgi:hypothetical protein